MPARVEADVRADALEPREQLLDARGAQVEDAVSIAAEPLELAPQVRAALRIDHHPRLRMRRLQRGDLAARRPARQPRAAEVAQHEARGVPVAALAVADRRLEA